MHVILNNIDTYWSFWQGCEHSLVWGRSLSVGMPCKIVGIAVGLSWVGGSFACDQSGPGAFLSCCGGY